MKLYLLDASVLLTANNNYYPFDQVPEYWNWIIYQGVHNRIKIPAECVEEITNGNDDLAKWMKDKKNVLQLDEVADINVVRRIVSIGYAPDLNDSELEGLRADPFLISYAFGIPERCIVTVEVSKPKAQRQNRKIPDVCNSCNIEWCDPFRMNRDLGFKTSWASDIETP